MRKPPKHIPSGPWRGVRTRAVLAAPEPDAAPRLVTLPQGWEEGAAAAVAALVPGAGPVLLEAAAREWSETLGDPALAERLHALLLERRAVPTAPVWRGDLAPLFPHPDAVPGFVLNLAAFADPATGFDFAAFAAAAADAAAALALLAPRAARRTVAMADLAGLLAVLGIDYEGRRARELAVAIAERLRDAVAPHAEAIVAAPGPAEALLGVETGGIAPAFSPLDDGGNLTRTARAWLAARDLAPEAALAAALAGAVPFPAASAAAHAAMREAVAPFLAALPALPLMAEPAADTAAPPAPRRRELPARHAGFTQRAQVGGHRVFLRTGEYADGTLGEIDLAVPRENAAFRGLVEAFAQAVSIGLQHGVPLAEYVEAMLLTRAGPAGSVEGDAKVTRATSVLDYAARTLAAHYLGRTDLPQPVPEEVAAPAPSLPLDLPAQPRLRLVR